MAEKDYYNILEIDEDASQDEVKKAYRSLARKYHPDVNPGDAQAAERFRLIKEAYDVLSNPLERDNYDRKRGGVFRSVNAQPPREDMNGYATNTRPAPDSTVGGFEDDDRPAKGDDLHYDLEITFDDAAFGLNTEIEIPVQRHCDQCKGSGVQPGTSPQRCPVCQGKGKVSVTRETPYGTQTSITRCERCMGRGEIVVYPCNRCNGVGNVNILERVFVKIPPGIENESRLRIKNKGEMGRNGGESGDLYITIFIQDHDFFERQGNDILCDVSITYPQAVLGADIDVPTMEGTARIKVPSGTQPGTIFKLKGKGIVDMINGVRGDQHVRIVIHVPSRINDKARSALQRYSQLIGPAPSQ